MIFTRIKSLATKNWSIAIMAFGAGFFLSDNSAFLRASDKWFGGTEFIDLQNHVEELENEIELMAVSNRDLIIESSYLSQKIGQLTKLDQTGFSNFMVHAGELLASGVIEGKLFIVYYDRASQSTKLSYSGAPVIDKMLAANVMTFLAIGQRVDIAINSNSGNFFKVRNSVIGGALPKIDEINLENIPALLQRRLLRLPTDRFSIDAVDEEVTVKVLDIDKNGLEPYYLLKDSLPSYKSIHAHLLTGIGVSADIFISVVDSTSNEINGVLLITKW